MRSNAWLRASLAALALIAAGACATKDETTSDAGSPGDITCNPIQTNKRISLAEACKRTQDALYARASQIGCVPLTVKPCPAYIQDQIPDKQCHDIDEGSIDTSVNFIKGFTKCSQFGDRPPCPIYYPDAPKYCGGSDAGTDATGDAPEEAAPDAGEAAAPDAIDESQPDAQPDAAPEGAPSEAAPDAGPQDAPSAESGD